MRLAVAALGLAGFAGPIFWSLDGLSLARWPFGAAAVLLVLFVARQLRVRRSFRRGVLVDAHVMAVRASPLLDANVIVATYEHDGQAHRARMLVGTSLDEVRERVGVGSFPIVVDRLHPSRAFPLGLYV